MSKPFVYRLSLAPRQKLSPNFVGILTAALLVSHPASATEISAEAAAPTGFVHSLRVGGWLSQHGMHTVIQNACDALGSCSLESAIPNADSESERSLAVTLVLPDVAWRQLRHGLTAASLQIESEEHGETGLVAEIEKYRRMQKSAIDSISVLRVARAASLTMPSVLRLPSDEKTLAEEEAELHAVDAVLSTTGSRVGLTRVKITATPVAPLVAWLWETRVALAGSIAALLLFAIGMAIGRRSRQANVAAATSASQKPVGASVSLRRCARFPFVPQPHRFAFVKRYPLVFDQALELLPMDDLGERVDNEAARPREGAAAVACTDADADALTTIPVLTEILNRDSVPMDAAICISQSHGETLEGTAMPTPHPKLSTSLSATERLASLEFPLPYVDDWIAALKWLLLNRNAWLTATASREAVSPTYWCNELAHRPRPIGSTLATTINLDASSENDKKLARTLSIAALASFSQADFATIVVGSRVDERCFERARTLLVTECDSVAASASQITLIREICRRLGVTVFYDMNLRATDGEPWVVSKHKARPLTVAQPPADAMRAVPIW